MIILTNGCFDLLHAGHVEFLEQARALGDSLIVAVNDDASVRRLKGPMRPIYPLAHRVKLLSALRCVDDVLPFGSEAELLRIVEALRPDVLAKGADSRQPIPGAEFAKRVALISIRTLVSTSDTIERINKWP